MKGLRNTNWQIQNSHADAKYSIENTVNNIVIIDLVVKSTQKLYKCLTPTEPYIILNVNWNFKKFKEQVKIKRPSFRGHNSTHDSWGFFNRLKNRCMWDGKKYCNKMEISSFSLFHSPFLLHTALQSPATRVLYGCPSLNYLIQNWSNSSIHINQTFVVH